MLKVAVIGSGYVGLVSGACFAEFGVHVTCVDSDKKKVDGLLRGEVPIFEPGLDTLVAENMRKERLFFTTNLQEAVSQADVVFIAVGTPSRRGDGHADLSYVMAATKSIAEAMNDYTVVVTKSTVPVGTGRQVSDLIRKTRPDARFDVVSNPEFLREGSAIGDFMRPDRVVVGTESDRAKEIMRQLYRPLYLLETPLLFTSLESAELIKYASNAFLATKITFINEMADICEKCGADVQDIATGMGLDGRIGKKFLHAGPGYGGSCFPKDTLALVKTAFDVGAPSQIVEAVVKVNASRRQKMTDKIMHACGDNLKGKSISVLGVTFKPNTDDMRDSPALDILPALQQAGAHIKVFDPQGEKEGFALLPGVEWCHDPYEAVGETDCVVLLTEWNEFRALDLDKIKMMMNTPLMVDLRNVYLPKEMKEAGFSYVSVGRPDVGIDDVSVASSSLSDAASL